MTILKTVFFTLFLTFFLQSCLCTDDTLDKEVAMSTVRLTKIDLENFDSLKIQLIHDRSEIQRLTPHGSGNWVTTNTYYLNQIDSIRYSAILSRLKGKYENNFSISDSGQIIFYLKTYVQRKCNDYNDTYQHQLVSKNFMYPAITCKNCPDTTLFIDSIINKDWRYVFDRYHSGH
jgi:hypothetical protein